MDGVAERAKPIKLGAAFNSESEIGPLMSETQLNRVQSYVQDGAKDGAKILAGGKHVGERGYFYEPTVLLSTTPAMSVEREEIFGPVVCAIPFDSAEEIPAIANQTLWFGRQHLDARHFQSVAIGENVERRSRVGELL